MTELRVHVDIAGRTVPAGVAYLNVTRSRLTTTFVYDSAFVADPEGYDLDPLLVRQSGQQDVDGLPGAFSDSAPDRWGRNLIIKRRRARQRQAEQRLPAVTDVDYLVGVSDLTRQGNLRFSVDNGPYLDPGTGVPALVSLPRLLASADQVADVRDPDDFAAVKALLEAGSGSLGGARPKASVHGDDGRLLIAKFPHRDDEWDVMAWEKATLDLASRAGLEVPGSRLTTVGARRVLLLDRFDRVKGQRVGYISAMTMLGARDGDEGDYGDLAQVLPESGASVKRDLRELFARVVFNVAVHNTDDHLRNHGFLRQPGGWSLSPVFDVNPNPDQGRPRVTAIMGAADASDEVDALLDFAPECRLSPPEARTIIDQVVRAVRGWKDVARGHGITEAEITLFQDGLEAQTQALSELTTLR